MFDQQAEILETRFDQAYNNLTTVIWDGTRTKPKIGEPFVRFSINWISSTLVAGDSFKGVWRELGMVTVEVYVPKNTGARLAYDIADVVEAVFRTWRSGDLRVKSTYTVRAGDEKEWFHLNVICPFTFDHQVGK